MLGKVKVDDEDLEDDKKGDPEVEVDDFKKE